MTTDEINRHTEKLYSKFKGIPGVDRIFIQKCILGITAMGDDEVEQKLQQLLNLL